MTRHHGLVESARRLLLVAASVSGRGRTLTRAVSNVMVGAGLLLVCGCGGATVSGPTDELPSLLADYGPQLSSYVKQSSVSGVSEVTDGLLGRSVAGGDFNADGRLDAATGAPGRDGGMVVVRQSYGRSSYWLYYIRLGSHDSTGQDDFGWSLASADFNGDGADDLAVGAPRLDVNGFGNAGGVFVMHGSAAAGLSNVVTRIAQGQDGVPEVGDLLGWSLAAGDFNADGYADLASGAPGEDFDGVNAGAVLVRWGSRNGLNRAFTPTLVTHPEPQANSQFGYTLAAGRFQSAVLINGHGVDDLAIASPFRTVTTYSVTARGNIVWPDAGEIMFHWGVRARTYGLETGTRLTDRLTDSPRFGWAMAAGRFRGGWIDQLAVGAPNHLGGRGHVAIVEPSRNRVNYRVYQAPGGLDEEGDAFGYALAAGDFDNDGFEDLAIGAPDEDGPLNSGVVHIRFGSDPYLIASVDPRVTGTVHLSYYISQASGIAAREAGDRFGMALAAGDLNGDGAADLLAGAPYEDIDADGRSVANAGALFLAISRAPRIGPMEGLWTGVINGDRRSSADVKVTLSDRNNVVGGGAEIAEPGIIINVAEVCAPRNDDDEQPTGARSLSINAETTAAVPRRVTDGGTINVGGFSIPYTLSLTVSDDDTTMAAEICITDPSPANICGGDRCFRSTLTKQ